MNQNNSDFVCGVVCVIKTAGYTPPFTVPIEDVVNYAIDDFAKKENPSICDWQRVKVIADIQQKLLDYAAQSEVWIPLNTEFIADGGNSYVDIADFSANFGRLFLTPKAYDALFDILNPLGVFLPVIYLKN